MKKVYFTLFLCLMIGIRVQAETIDTIDTTHSLEEKFKLMNLVAYTSLNRIKLNPEKRDDISIDQRYSINNEDIEYNYSLFPWYCFSNYLGKEYEIDKEKQIFMIFTGLILRNVLRTEDFSKYNLKVPNVNNRYYSDMYNADFGFAVLFDVPEKFNKNYKYAQQLFLYKNKSGVIVITILTNNRDAFSKIKVMDILTFKYK